MVRENCRHFCFNIHDLENWCTTSQDFWQSGLSSEPDENTNIYMVLVDLFNGKSSTREVHFAKLSTNISYVENSTAPYSLVIETHLEDQDYFTFSLTHERPLSGYRCEKNSWKFYSALRSQTTSSSSGRWYDNTEVLTRVLWQVRICRADVVVHGATHPSGPTLFPSFYFKRSHSEELNSLHSLLCDWKKHKYLSNTKSKETILESDSRWWCILRSESQLVVRSPHCT
jgi:hypothetical protein